MINETIAKIEAQLKNLAALSPEKRQELSALLAQLKSELNTISSKNEEAARSIAGFAQVSAYEATRDEKNPKTMELSLKGLSSTVEGFEQSHPKLVETVNNICTMLSNLGI